MSDPHVDASARPDDELAARLMAEGLISLVDAAASLPKIRGKGVSSKAVFRWCVHGKRGVKLEYVRLHGTHLWTSKPALARFAAALTAKESQRHRFAEMLAGVMAVVEWATAI